MTEQQRFLNKLKDPLRTKIDELVVEFVHTLVHELNYMYDDVPFVKHTDDNDGTHVLRIECKNRGTMQTIDELMGHRFDGYLQYIRQINTDAHNLPVRHLHDSIARMYYISSKPFGY